MKGESSLFSRIKDFPIPPKQLDLTTASETELQAFGIPPRPDPKIDSALYDVWFDFFGTRPEFVQADIEIRDDEFQPVTREARVAPASSTLALSRFETSKNWCGVFIEPSHGTVFVQVSGRWVVPIPDVPLDGGPGLYACSTWVGFDGQRRYLDSSLPQIGTWQAVTLSNDGITTIETYAWFQWWARDLPGTQPGVIKSVPVAPGDPVLCMVQVWEPNVAVVYIKNARTGRLAHFSIEAPLLDLGNGRFHKYRISGATAEWIMERPTPLQDPNSLYALADYGHADLLDCHASEADPTLPGWPWLVGTDRVLRGERLIRMCDVLYDPMRIAFNSMPERQNDTSVRATYGGFR
jgi:hypothetical protein